MLTFYIFGLILAIINFLILYNIRDPYNRVCRRIITKRHAFMLGILTLIPFAGFLINSGLFMSNLIVLTFDDFQFMSRKDGKKRKFWNWLNTDW